MTRRAQRTIDGVPIELHAARFSGEVDLTEDEAAQLTVDSTHVLVSVVRVAKETSGVNSKGEMGRVDFLKVGDMRIADEDLTAELIARLSMGVEQTLDLDGNQANGSSASVPAPAAVAPTPPAGVDDNGEVGADDDDGPSADVDWEGPEEEEPEDEEEPGPTAPPPPPEPRVEKSLPNDNESAMVLSGGERVGQIRPTADPLLAKFLEGP